LRTACLKLLPAGPLTGLPSPSVSDDLVQIIVTWLPTQLLANASRICHQSSWITSAARFIHASNRAASNLASDIL
jgi:hypothetical protein